MKGFSSSSVKEASLSSDDSSSTQYLTIQWQSEQPSHLSESLRRFRTFGGKLASNVNLGTSNVDLGAPLKVLVFLVFLEGIV